MNEVIVFPQVVVDQVLFLRSVLGVPVHEQVPNPRPPVFVVVERVGGASMSRIHERPLVSYRATAPDILEAEGLIGLVKAHVLSQDCFYSEVGGPAFLPDPDDGLPRFQFSAQLQLRGDRL